MKKRCVPVILVVSCVLVILRVSWPQREEVMRASYTRGELRASYTHGELSQREEAKLASYTRGELEK